MYSANEKLCVATFEQNVCVQSVYMESISFTLNCMKNKYQDTHCVPKSSMWKKAIKTPFEINFCDAFSVRVSIFFFFWMNAWMCVSMCALRTHGERVQRRQVVDRSPPKRKLTIVICMKTHTDYASYSSWNFFHFPI